MVQMLNIFYFEIYACPRRTTLRMLISSSHRATNFIQEEYMYSQEKKNLQIVYMDVTLLYSIIKIVCIKSIERWFILFYIKNILFFHLLIHWKYIKPYKKYECVSGCYIDS